MTAVTRGAVLAVLVVLVFLSLSLTVPVQGGETEPVAFDDTFTLGMTGETLRQAEAAGLSVPRVEAYYSGFEYVVGFNGIQAFVTEQARAGHERQFGRPIALFVTDFADANVSLTPSGYLTATKVADFTPAEDTVVVVGSRARLPGGPVAVPFGDRASARAFADEYGGEVYEWDAALDRLGQSRELEKTALDGEVAERRAWADARVAATASLLDRPVSVVVGTDAPTVAAAVEAAPPNTTVRVPAGTYDVGTLDVTKPVTVRGAGQATTLHGDNNGSVLRFGAPRSALADLSVDGVGPVGSGFERENATGGEDLGWSGVVEVAYGRGDAAVKLFGANRSLVRNVSVETPSNGFISLGSRGAVLRNVSVDGGPTPEEGFMGLVTMYEPLVVEESQFVDGRDGIYTHRADGTVVRDSYFADARYGVHLMYTGDTLIANNTVRDERIGLIAMTRPTGNAVVDNDVRESEVGISVAGSRSYYAGNVLVDNGRGMDLLGYRSLFTHNTIVGNGVGLRGGSALPTNLVTSNDVVDNGRPARTGFATVRVWTVDGVGNYWGPLPGTVTGGTYDRPFRPTGPLDRHVHDAVGAWTLGQSPAVAVLRDLQRRVPSLRSAGVVDAAPRVTPTRPAVLAAVRANATAREVSA